MSITVHKPFRVKEELPLEKHLSYFVDTAVAGGSGLRMSVRTVLKGWSQVIHEDDFDNYFVCIKKELTISTNDEKKIVKTLHVGHIPAGTKALCNVPKDEESDANDSALLLHIVVPACKKSFLSTLYELQ